MHILYIKQALRTLSRQKVFTGINILGLAISLACCILLSRYLHHETTAESHAIDIDHIMAIKSKSSRDYTSFSTKFELVDYLEPSFATSLNEQVVESSWHGIYAAMNFEYNDDKGQEVTRKASAMVADSLLLHFYDYHIYLLLGMKYIYMLTATFALSIPVSYLLIHRYTESFIESAPLTPIIYIEALGIVVLITLLTLIYQLEKAARINVATVVKNE